MRWKCGFFSNSIMECPFKGGMLNTNFSVFYMPGKNLSNSPRLLKAVTLLKFLTISWLLSAVLLGLLFTLVLHVLILINCPEMMD